MDPELDGRLQVDPVSQEVAPGPDASNAAHAAEIDRLLAEAAKEGAPAAPSDPSAPPGTWTWENIKRNLKEVPGQVVRGGAEAVNAADDGIEKMAKWLNTNIVNLDAVAASLGITGENVGKPLIPDTVLPDQPQTGLGQVTNDAAQLAVGLIGAGKLIRVAEGASAVGAFGARMAQGALADLSVFKGSEENLANFMEKHTSVAPAVMAFLATHPDDNDAVGRLKNAVSGAVVGAGLEGLIAVAKVVRASAKGNKEAALKALDEVDAAHDAGLKPKDPEVTPGAPEKPQDDQLDLFGGKPQEKPAEAPKEAQGPANGEPQMSLDLGDAPLAHAPSAVAEKVPGATKPVGMAPVKKIVTVDDDTFKEFLSARDWNKGLFQGEGQAVTALNTKLIDNADEIAPTINAIAETFEKEISKARGGDYVSWDETRALAGRIADLTGGKDQVILQQLARDNLNMSQMSARMKAYADFHATVAKKVDDLATYVADEFGPVPPGYKSMNDVMADFAKHTELLANVQAMYGGAKTNLARTFNAFKMGGEVNQKLAGMNPDELFAGGPAAMRAYARKIKGAGGNPKAIAKVTERGLLQNLMKFGQQIWINGILSSPATHVANTLGSAAHMVYLPAEKMFAGAIRSGSKEGRAAFVQGALEYKGMVDSVRDALHLSVNAFKREAPIRALIAGKNELLIKTSLIEIARRLNEAVEVELARYSRGVPMIRDHVIAYDQIAKVSKTVDAFETATTIAAMFLLRQKEPRRFASDPGMIGQLVRQYRLPAGIARGVSYDRQTGKDIGWFKPLPRKATQVMGDLIVDAYTPWLVQIMKAEQRMQEHEEKVAKDLARAFEGPEAA